MSDSGFRTLTLILAAGFPIAVSLSWLFEFSSGKIQRTKSESDPIKSIPFTTDLVVIFLLLAVVGIDLSERLLGDLPATQFPDEQVQVIRSSINVGELERRELVGMRSDVAISPDGSQLAYTGKVDGIVNLYLRDLTGTDSRILVPGESNSIYPIVPVFSPTGDEILYVRFGTGQLHIIPVSGGRSQMITDIANTSMGVSWLNSETLAFTHVAEQTIYTVSTATSETNSLEIPRTPDEDHFWPSPLPDSDWIIYTVVNSINYNEGRIDAFNTETREVRTVVDRGYNARFANSGHIVFVRDGGLLATPFDTSSIEVLGDSVAVIDEVEHNSLNSGKVSYSFSDNGRLVYLNGIDGTVATQGELVLQDLEGERFEHKLPANSFQMAFSPDGRRLTFALNESGGWGDIAVYNFTDHSYQRRTFNGRATHPIWEPGGDHIYYAMRMPDEPDNSGIWTINADGSGQPEQIFRSPGYSFPSSLSTTPNELIFSRGVLPNVKRISSMSFDNPENAISDLMTNAQDQGNALLSPDGEWLAYLSNELGSYEIFIVPYPFDGAGKRQITVSGAQEFQWGGSGSELYYLDPSTSRVNRVTIDTNSGLQVSDPEPITVPIAWSGTFGSPHFAVNPEGNRIIYRARNDEFTYEAEFTSFEFIDNWVQSLNQVAPRRRD